MSQNVEWMKGYTYHVTFQILAQVGLDVTGGVRIPTYVRSEVAWVAQVFYEMAECKVNTRMLTRYVSENIPTGTTGANLRTINEVDVVQTEQEV